MNLLKTRYSFISIAVVIAVYLVLFLRVGVKPIGYDAIGYYSYLPQTFILHDLKPESLSYFEEMVNKYELPNTGLYQYNLIDDKIWVPRYPIGVALLHTPAFLVAHAVALLSGGPADGYSNTYQLFLFFSHCIYLIVGFVFLRKLIRMWFSERIAAIVILIIGLFTTFFSQGIFGAGMSHGPLFALQMMIIYFSARWHETHNNKTFFLLGFLIALAAVSRPTEILICIVPLLWNVNRFNQIGGKLRWLIQQKGKWLVFFGGFLIPVALQMSFWWHTTGSPVYYSYSGYGEGFEFLRPFIIDSFFSPWSGLFLYSPILVFAIIGLFIGLKSKENFLPLLVFITIAIYVTASWSCVRYGFRAYTQTFGIMAIGLASFLFWLSQRRLITKGIFSLLIFCCLGFTTFSFIQFFNLTVIPEKETWTHYKKVFGQLTAPEEIKEHLRVDVVEQLLKPDPFKGYYQKQLYFFEGCETQGYGDSIAFEGARSSSVPDDVPYSPAIEGTLEMLTEKDHVILKCSFWYYATKPLDSLNFWGVVHFRDKGNAYWYRSTQVLDPKAELNKWNYFEFLYVTPEVRRRSDPFIFYVWKRGTGKLLIDALKIQVYERIE